MAKVATRVESEMKNHLRILVKSQKAVVERGEDGFLNGELGVQTGRKEAKMTPRKEARMA